MLENKQLFEILPPEIILNILKFLDIYSLSKFALSCKQAATLVDQSFINEKDSNHIQRYVQELDALLLPKLNKRLGQKNLLTRVENISKNLINEQDWKQNFGGSLYIDNKPPAMTAIIRDEINKEKNKLNLDIQDIHYNGCTYLALIFIIVFMINGLIVAANGAKNNNVILITAGFIFFFLVPVSLLLISSCAENKDEKAQLDKMKTTLSEGLAITTKSKGLIKAGLLRMSLFNKYTPSFQLQDHSPALLDNNNQTAELKNLHESYTKEIISLYKNNNYQNTFFSPAINQHFEELMNKYQSEATISVKKSN